MGDAIRKPSQNIQSGALVCGKYVTKVGAIENILERRKDFDPNWGPVVACDESGNRSAHVDPIHRPHRIRCSETYWHENQKRSQAITGVAGSAICAVMGITKLVRNAVAKSVFTNGPGLSIIESANRPIIVSRRYCPS